MRHFLLALWLLFPLQAVAFDACSPQAAESYQSIEQQSNIGLLYRVEKCGAPPNYVFGTMHTDDPRFNALLNNAARTMSTTNTAYFEILSDAQSAQKALGFMRLPQGETLQKMVGDALFKKATNAMQTLGFPADVVNQLTPWAVAVLIQLPPNKADGMVVDEKLQSFAASSGKKVMALEKLEDHFGIFINLPKPQQIEMLEESLSDLAETKAMNDQLENAYQNQDLRRIQQLGDQSFADIGDPKLREYLETKLLTERNKLMAQTLTTPLTQGNVFIAVGAMHLPGEEGLLHLLEQQGYFVTPVAGANATIH